MIFSSLVLLLRSCQKENLKGETNLCFVGFILYKCSLLLLQLHCIVLMPSIRTVNFPFLLVTCVHSKVA